MLRRQPGFGHAINQLFAHSAIADQLFDRNDLHPMLAGQLEQPHPRGAVARRAEHFAQYATGRQRRHARQIDRGLGMARAPQHAPLLGHQRKQVPRAHEVGRLARGVDDGLDREGPLLRRDAGLRRFVIHRHRVRRAQERGIRLDHWRELQAFRNLGQDRHAQLAAAMSDHEVDDLGRRLFGGADEIAFVLAVFGVDHDHHFAAGDRANRGFNRRKISTHARRFQLDSSALY